MELLRADPVTGAPGLLIAKFGGPGCWVLLVLSTLIAFMLATEMAFYPALLELKAWMDERRGEPRGGRSGAVLAWCGARLGGLWDFLRGRDLEPEPVPVSGWHVFSPEGELLGRVATPLGLEVHEIGADYLLGVELDELEVSFVRRYPLARLR